MNYDELEFRFRNYIIMIEYTGKRPTPRPGNSGGSSSNGERPGKSFGGPPSGSGGYAPRSSSGDSGGGYAPRSSGGSSGGYSRSSGSSSGGGYSRSSGGYSGGGGFGGRRNSRPSNGGGNRGNNALRGSKINIAQLIHKVEESAIVTTVPEQVLEHQFKDFLIDDRLFQNIHKKGYISPTPIQDKAIPEGLKGRDVIGIANTGTGKTAAFLIPLIDKVLKDRSQKIIIMAPTRELAMQIQDEFIGFTRGFNMHSVLCIGGTNLHVQARKIKMPFNFLIGTPGRIKDLYMRRFLHLDRFQSVVLDEADRMVDMGFITDIRYILGLLPKVRHSFFFTATLERDVEQLIQEFLTNPVKISVKMRETSANVEQDIIKVGSQDKKMEVLQELLIKPVFERVLVFVNTKHKVEKVAVQLRRAGVLADSIHGDKSQGARQRALQAFKDGRLKVLVATDVAARGLDIPNVSHVINFDVPIHYEDYVHRIGRTGRADKKGVALTFIL